jgi:transposase
LTNRIGILVLSRISALETDLVQLRREDFRLIVALSKEAKMRQKTGPQTSAAEKTIKDIRRATRKHHSAEDKIRIVLEGLSGEDSIAAICRREGIAESVYYSRSKEFLEAGKKRLAGDTARSATSDEVKALRRESRDLKEALADLTLENRLLKKSMIADGGDDE